MNRRQIANLIIDAMACRSCGAVFDHLNDPHTDQDCPKGHASWREATREEIAKAVYDTQEAPK